MQNVWTHTPAKAGADGFRAIHIGRHTIAALTAAAAFVIFAAPAQADGLFENPTQFTARQAERGKALYSDNCQMCHGANLDDGQFGPALKGEMFRNQWHTQTKEALFSFLTSKMPPTNPGVLDPQSYADVEAYILAANGDMPGRTEMTAAELGKVVAQAGGAKASSPPKETNGGPENDDSTYRAVIAAHKAKLDSLTSVTDDVLRNPPVGDWLTWRRTYEGQGYSPLAQINRANVHNLQVAWSWSLPISPNEITPLVHDGVMFVKSANEVQALDAATGDLLWKYTRTLPEAMHNGSRSPVKNLAIYQDKLFAPMADGHIVALDVKTGKVVWDHEVVDPKDRLALDGGPIVIHGKVIMGASFCMTYKGGCFIVALDARDGHEVWRFHTIARPGQPGGDSWNGAPVEERFGGSVWTSGSYDPDLNLVYFGIGQTYDTATLLMPRKKKGKSNDALYTDATVAINPDTGKLVWYYQHMNRDVWDYDWVFEQTLLTLPVDSKPTKLVVTGGKIAIFDAVNRANGKYVFSKDLGLQTLVSRVDPRTGKKIIDPKFKPEANVTKFVCPHAGGARSWPATSYNPQTKTLYVPLTESCMGFTWKPRSPEETANGTMDIHWVLHPRPDSDGKFGRVEAINLETRKVEWIKRERAPETASTVATGGGIVFDGTRDRHFRALDEANGNTLWQTRLNAVPSSTPVTFTAGGQQYVAVVAGGGGPHEATWPSLTPEIKGATASTTVWVFKLPADQ